MRRTFAVMPRGNSSSPQAQGALSPPRGYFARGEKQPEEAAMSVTNICNLTTTRAQRTDPENRVVTVATTAFVLKFVNKAKFQKMVDDLHEIAKTCDANGAVDLTFFIPNPDLHALHADGFFSAGVQRQIARDLGIEIWYVLTDEQGSYHFVTPSQLGYVERYFQKRSVAAHKVGTA
jgi:hypothetical protein